MNKVAGLIGGLLGLSTLLYSIAVILAQWHGMKTHLRVYVLIVPSMFITIALIAGLMIVGWALRRLYHRITNTAVIDEFAFLNSNRWTGWILPLWVVVGYLLYSVIDQGFG